MSGILNSKQRFVDTVITAEGRRQLASGEFQIEFVTFSDAEVFYQKDAVSGTIDQSKLIQLEAASDLVTDVVTVESNLFGNVVSDVVPGLKIASGSRMVQDDGTVQLVNGSVVQFTNSGSKNVITGSEYTAILNGILSSSIKNFNRLQTVGTEDMLLDEQDFELSRDFFRFEITDKNVTDICALPRAEITRDAESIHQDRHLSHLPNYKYLPPRNTPTPTRPTGSVLFDYPNNSQADIITTEEYEREVKFLPKRVVNFQNTSIQNNLVCQMFETSGDYITKLSAIDFGEFETGDPDNPTKRVFFVGRVFPVDDNGTETYVNMFTLEFD